MTLFASHNMYTAVFTDSKANEKLSDLLTNSNLCKDITRLSPVHQTSSLEAFHSVNPFCSQVCSLFFPWNEL